MKTGLGHISLYRVGNQNYLSLLLHRKSYTQYKIKKHAHTFKNLKKLLKVHSKSDCQSENVT